jgi:predicted permease
VRDGDAVARMEHNILDKLSAVPGVSSAGIINVIAMTTKAPIDAIWSQDQPDQAKGVPKLRRFKFISPGFLQTIGTPLVSGREFTWTETYERRPVAMVSENLARELWGGPDNAIGKQIHENPSSPWREVIGVVGDEREDGVDHDAPQMVYFPLLMSNYMGNIERLQRSVAYAIRSSRAGTQGFLPDIQRAVWSVNPSLPLAQVRTLSEIYDKSLARTSFTLVMLAIAGAMALLIGLMGIYGVVSYAVSRRRREIGIRLALGAPTAGLVRMFVRQGLALGAAGTGCGIIAALWMTRLISSLLFHVSAADPATYAAVSAALLIATSLASYIPARWATQVDPLEVLRAE